MKMLNSLLGGLFGALLLLCSAQMVAAQESATAVRCNAVKLYDASTNGATVLVPGLGKNTAYICGFTLWAGGTATVKFEYGTGSACATGETAITPAFSLVAQTGLLDSSSAFRGLTVPPGKDICIKTSAGVAVQALLFYKRL